MTDEKLEKEAGEYAKPFHDMTRYDYVEERTHVKQAYLAGAKPREKQIEELKDDNNKLLDVINNQDVKIADLEEDLKLAEYNLKVKQDFNDNQYAYGLKISERLEQAKEIITELLKYVDTEAVEMIKEAEQFLKE